MQDQTERLNNSAIAQKSLLKEANTLTACSMLLGTTSAAAMPNSFALEQPLRILDPTRIFFQEKDGQTQQLADSAPPTNKYEYSVSLRPFPTAPISNKMHRPDATSNQLSAPEATNLEYASGSLTGVILDRPLYYFDSERAAQSIFNPTV